LKKVEGNLVIGVDCGTSATKAILFDELGRIRAEGRSSYPILHPHPGWAEQQAEWWWEAFKNAVGSLLEQCPAPLDIRGIAVTHQRITYVPVDRRIRVLRPAILWNDIRCFAQDKRALEVMDGGLIYDRTGYMPGLWTIYKIMWLKENEPEIYKNTYKILLVQDYLVYRLTGELLTTASSAVMTGCLDVRKKNQWATDIIEAFGISPALFLDKILDGGEIAGFIHREAAEQTGLPEGLPVITAAGDQPCGVLGAGVVEPHMASINGGTSCTIETCCREFPTGSAANYFIEISPTGDYLPENSVPSGGSSLMNWLRDLFGAETDWGSFYQMAENAPPGNSGLMLIPYFSGTNAPYWDLNARGIIFGLWLDHDRSHLVRAVIEGLAYETRRLLDLMKKGTGNPISIVRMYGGSAKSDTWNQIFSDVLGLAVHTLDTPETTALGAALCAAKALGVYPGFTEAVRKMVRVKKQYSPDRGRQDLYDGLFHEVYEKFYDRVSGLVHDLSERTGRTSQ
jgi:sugar (pentulose or hexulose) kinase